MPQIHEEDESDELNISDDGDAGDEASTSTEEEDRGDVVNPEETPENLAAVAAEGEEEEEGEDEGEEKPAASGPSMIPKGRFNEINEAFKAERAARLRLEEELARARGAAGQPKTETPATQAAAEPDLKALRKQRTEALLEGDTDKVAELEDKIDAIIEERATQSVMASMKQREDTTTFQAAVDAAIADYPFLDVKNKAANTEAIELVIALRDKKIAEGMSAAEALVTAVERIGPRYAPKAEEKPAAEAEPPAKSKLDELKAARLRRNADTANRQPAALTVGMGTRAAAAKPSNVREMSDDEFEALPEKERAKLRGDLA